MVQIRLTKQRLQHLTTYICDTSYSVRLSNCLEGWLFIADVVRCDEHTLLQIPQFGKKVAEELKDDLKKHGLQLGLTFTEEQEERILQARCDVVSRTPYDRGYRFFGRLAERLVSKDRENRDEFINAMVRKMCHSWAHSIEDKRRPRVIEHMRFMRLGSESQKSKLLKEKFNQLERILAEIKKLI